MYQRSYYQLVRDRVLEPRKFIQVLVGARQVGKTTLINQVLKDISIPFTFHSADNVPVVQSSWISNSWDSVRTQMKLSGQTEHLLVFDEIQKLDNWSEVIKNEWDKDSWDGVNIKLVLLGSSRLLIKKGLTESLAGRFELIRLPHWSFSEMHEAFGWNINQYIYFGGYPGASELIDNEERWRNYIKDSIIETTISKDILMLTQVNKPALLRQLFELGSIYSGQMVSLTKMLGQLADAGNVTTLSGYLNLLTECSMLTGLPKYIENKIKKRSSIPKFQVYNNALMNVYSEFSFQKVQENPKEWGRLVESAVGAHLLNFSENTEMNIYYWNDGCNEVDFILQKNKQLIAIEIKSGKRSNNAGLFIFRDLYQPKSAFTVGTGGISLEDFLSSDPNKLFE